jgi:hypothetical protein
LQAIEELSQPDTLAVEVGNGDDRVVNLYRNGKTVPRCNAGKRRFRGF